MAKASSGRVVVISGPSGAGKSTLRRRLIECAPVPLVRSVSATTRQPRPGEVNDVDYHFLSQEEFARRRRRGEFLECFQVFEQGDWYGTPRDEVAAGLADGKWVLLEIDVQGAQAVERQYPDAISIFIRPSSVEELERRLRGRNTETDLAVELRLKEARAEIAMADRYRYQVVNDDLDRAVEEIRDILTQTEKNAHA